VSTLVPDTRELYLRSKRTRDFHLDMARRFGNTVKGRKHIADALSAARIGNAMLALHRQTNR
jgi:hypothetical protein